MRTFFDWIKTQVLRDDPVGDLAKDIVEDAKSNGLEYKTADDWKRHVKFIASNEGALDALKRARKEYKSLVKEYPELYEDN